MTSISVSGTSTNGLVSSFEDVWFGLYLNGKTCWGVVSVCGLCLQKGQLLYLETTLTTQNYISEENKSGLSLGNAWYHSVHNIPVSNLKTYG
jgi:hypothetical protein